MPKANTNNGVHLLHRRPQPGKAIGKISERTEAAAYVSLNGYLLELATTRFEQALFKSNRVVRLGDIVKLEDSKRVPLNSRDRDARKGTLSLLWCDLDYGLC